MKLCGNAFFAVFMPNFIKYARVMSKMNEKQPFANVFSITPYLKLFYTHCI